MSDKKMTDSLSPDDHAILLALALVTAGGIEVPLPVSADRARVREYVELLGLLPYGLEPAAPRAEVKARILGAIGVVGGAALPQRSFDEVTLDGSADSHPLDMTFRRVAPVNVTPAGSEPEWQELLNSEEPFAAEPDPATEPEWRQLPTPALPADAEPVTAEAVTATLGWQETRPPQPASAPEPAAFEPPWQEPEPQPRATPETAAAEPATAEPGSQEPVPSNVVPISQARANGPAWVAGSWWTPALAAMLAFCMLGLAYLAGKVDDQNTTITRLNSELEGLPIQDLSSFYDEFSTMKRRFDMVTAVARHAYPMKTVQPLAPGVQTDGMVYVCGNHQRWYLNLQGLVPPPPGEEYNLWFVTEQGMVSGGVIEVQADASSEMEAQSLPPGTRGFAVTRERAGVLHAEPAGAMMLLAEESIPL